MVSKLRVDARRGAPGEGMKGTHMPLPLGGRGAGTSGPAGWLRDVPPDASCVSAEKSALN